MEYPDRLIRSKKFRDHLRTRSLEKFCGVQCAIGSHQFIIDDFTAAKMAEALSTKNPGLMKSAIGNSIEQVSKETLESPLNIYIEEWNEALGNHLGEDTTIYELLSSSETEDITKLRMILKSSRDSQLGLETDSYIRLIQTIALCTIPDNGLRTKHITNSHIRASNSKTGIFSLSVNILNDFTMQEPGLGMLRNNVLNIESDENLIDTYLARLQKSETSKNALARIIDLVDENEISELRQDIFKELESYNYKPDNNEDIKLHLLSWEILPHDCDEIDVIKELLRKKAKSLAKTAKAKATFEQRFDDSRLDTIFTIAHQEAAKGRAVEIYISSAFNNSQEFYVAVEFEHHKEPDIKIVIADNPMSGNAIYMVDEQYTQKDEEGINYKWQKVLGASKKIARRRGARRRFHVGEWQKHANHFCIHGAGKMAVRGSALNQEPTKTELDQPITDIIDTAKQTEDSLPAEQAKEVLSEDKIQQQPKTSEKDSTEKTKPDIQKALDNITAIRKAIDKIYKDIIDKE